MFSSCLAKPFAHLSVRTFRWVRSPAATELRLYSGQDKLVPNDRNQIYINLNKTENVWLMKSKGKAEQPSERKSTNITGLRNSWIQRPQCRQGFIYLGYSSFFLPRSKLLSFAQLTNLFQRLPRAPEFGSS